MRILISPNERILQITAELSYYMGFTFSIKFLTSKIFKKDKVIILMYHRIFDIKNCDFDLDVGIVSPSEFERQIEYISKNYTPISFNDLITCAKKNKFPANPIIITIDDGYKDSYINAYPILRKFDVPATIFLATDSIESFELFWWDKVAYLINNTKIPFFSIPDLGSYNLGNKPQRITIIRDIIKKLKKINEENKKKIIDDLINTLEVKSDLEDSPFLTWNEIKEMSSNNIEFGAHSCSHAILTKVPYDQAKNEILKSRSIIEKGILQKVNFFSYPSGTINDFNENIKTILKNENFKAAVTTVYGINRVDSKLDFYSLKRLNIDAGITMNLFKLSLTGMLDYVYQLQKMIKHLYNSI